MVKNRTMCSRRHYLSVALVLLMMAASPLVAGNLNFRAHLDGTDAETGSRGQGQAIFKFSEDETSIWFKLIVANIEDVTMAHIHLITNFDTRTGPPVVWLYPSGPPPVPIPGRSDGVLSAGVITSSSLVGPLAGMTLQELKQHIMAGETYVNVHTQQHPPGEIRGEIQ